MNQEQSTLDQQRPCGQTRKMRKALENLKLVNQHKAPKGYPCPAYCPACIIDEVLAQLCQQPEALRTIEEQEPHGPEIEPEHGLDCYGCGLIALRQRQQPQASTGGEPDTGDIEALLDNLRNAETLDDRVKAQLAIVNLVAAHNASRQCVPEHQRITEQARDLCRLQEAITGAKMGTPGSVATIDQLCGMVEKMKGGDAICQCLPKTNTSTTSENAGLSSGADKFNPDSAPVEAWRDVDDDEKCESDRCLLRMKANGDLRPIWQRRVSPSAPKP